MVFKNNKTVIALAGLVGVYNAQHVAAKDFTLLPYDKIVQEMQDLESNYPGFVELTTAQDKYGLPHVGECSTTGDKCKQWIITVTNEANFNEDTPEILVSGLLHGDERAGATVTIEALKLLLERYDTNPWIKHLVDTRAIVATPMTNARGYYEDLREERSIAGGEDSMDPNRDFPFDDPPLGCMNTVAARTINELSLEHLFQVSLTFHGGIQIINYMWAATSFIDQPISPDDIAQRVMGSVLSATAGSYIEGRFPHGRGNDIFYDVRGGMEDWAYAGAWRPNSEKCTGTANGLDAYPPNKTTYDMNQLGHINILVETAAEKNPRAETLGTDDDILQIEGDGDGHIPRNIRIILTAMDLLQPYIMWTEEASEQTEFTVKPGAELPLSWEVGGAAHVAETRLLWGDAPAGGDATKPGFGLTASQLRSEFDDENDFAAYVSAADHGVTDALSGLTRWAGGGIFGSEASSGSKDVAVTGGNTHIAKGLSIHDRELRPFIPAWKASMTAPNTPGEYWVMATAVVDQDFSESTDPVVVPEKPFSHWANARTSTTYAADLPGHRVRGQRTWYSKPIKVIVSESAADLNIESCKDLSPSGVELLGEIVECSSLTTYCDEYDFVKAACPSTCGICATPEAIPDPNPKPVPGECGDKGGLVSAINGGEVSCESVKDQCKTSALVVERCSNTCGRCFECKDQTGIVASGGGVDYTCADIVAADFCNAAAFLKEVCPVSCDGCDVAIAAIFPGAYDALFTSPIIPLVNVAGTISTVAPTNTSATVAPTNISATLAPTNISATLAPTKKASTGLSTEVTLIAIAAAGGVTALVVLNFLRTERKRSESESLREVSASGVHYMSEEDQDFSSP